MGVSWIGESEAMTAVTVVEVSQVAQARRTTTDLTRSIGMSEAQIASVSLIVTELASNLVHHAKKGQILVRPLRSAGVAGLELLSVDHGPGISDIGSSLLDGVSTRGGPGTGLGAVRRAASEFDVYSTPGKGTVVLARFWAGRGSTTTGPAMRIGAICLPKPGAEVSGDQWAANLTSDRWSLMAVDGLGHGPLAQTAARAAVDVFRTNPGLSPADLCRSTHAALSHTRGAAFAALELQFDRREVRFAGVGNIAAMLVGGGHRYHFVSHNGIVGHRINRIQEFTTTWEPGALLVVHSDGLGSQWALDAYPGLPLRDPSVIAAVLYRDFDRQTDDTTVLVIRMDERAGGASA
jgi:anti-sigma regulatory factor (Ser/Thr protein kinase)